MGQRAAVRTHVLGMHVCHALDMPLQILLSAMRNNLKSGNGAYWLAAASVLTNPMQCVLRHVEQVCTQHCMFMRIRQSNTRIIGTMCLSCVQVLQWHVGYAQHAV